MGIPGEREVIAVFWGRKYQLRIQEADGSTWVFPLEAWRLTIGRPLSQEEGTDKRHLRISDPYLCGVQAELRWSLLFSTYVLYHKGKVNKTYIQGRPFWKVILVPGDFIGMGRTKMIFETLGSSEPEAVSLPEDEMKPVLSWFPDDEWVEQGTERGS